ncbi:MAG: iron-containing alcohol dehydrogenase [Desulfofustis sp.]|nr:iron-containing alcohol dehydrogenase [Desulfofustis sp.]
MDTNLLFKLRKFLVPEIVYGVGSLELAGRHARNLGASRVLLVSDSGIRESGWLNRVENSLRQAQLTSSAFTDISPNPRDHEVMAGAERYRSEGCDLIVAVGGGSPMDCAKGIGVVVTNGGFITDFEGVDEIANPVPPLVFIPTTAGTSADVSQFAIISDTRRRVKIAIVSKMVIPDIALVDPQTTITMPADLTAATGMDALCHAFEAAVSTASSPLTDMAARSAITLVFDNLPGACREPGNMVYRDQMMMASLMAGLAFSNASLGIVHAMAHSLGGRMDLAHGECNALLLEKAIVYNYPHAADQYDRLAPLLGLDIERIPAEDRATTIADKVASLRRMIGINQRLSDYGVQAGDLPQLAQMASQDPCLATNPREAQPADIESLYRQVL